MKTDPDTYGIDHLAAQPNQTDYWDGVRNYQARNLMRDDMAVGDKVFIYHSVIEPIGIVGEAEIVREAYPDPSQFDPKSKYHDAKSTEENPRWVAVDVKLTKKYDEPVLLKQLKQNPDLEGLMVIRKGSRLSIQPVEEAHWQVIRKMAGQAS